LGKWCKEDDLALIDKLAEAPKPTGQLFYEHMSEEEDADEMENCGVARSHGTNNTAWLATWTLTSQTQPVTALKH